MKIDANNNQQRDDAHLASEHRPIRHEQRITSRIKPRPGQKVFSYNLDTEEVTEAEFEAIYAEMTDPRQKKYMQPGVTVRKKVKQLPNHLYCAALNKENAERKFAKQITKLVADGILIKK